MNRRSFVKSALVTSACAAITATPARSLATPHQKKILILGGTHFLGPAVVEAALIGGHEVTIFNRNVSHPEMFPNLEKLWGFRSVDERLQNLDSLRSRRWDAVIDVWPHEPSIVASTATLLREKVDQYLFVSTTGVYASYPATGNNEESPTKAYNGKEDDYKPAKAESERRLRKILGDGLTIVRPCGLMGWRSGNPDILQFLLRAESGGEHIGPGDGNDYYQEIDYKDVSRFLIRAVEQNITGTFNTTSKPMHFSEFLAACNDASDSNAIWTWIPRDFLQQAGISDSKYFVGWEAPEWRGVNLTSSDKAFSTGWKTRPFSETAREILAFYHLPSTKISDWRDPDQRPWADPLTPEKERAVLLAWKQRKS